MCLHKIPICCSIFVFKLYHKTCEQFYRNFGLYEKSPNSFLPGLPRSIINQFRFHNFLCLCLASVHLPYPFHLVFGFQLFSHAVLLCQFWHDQLHAVSCRFVDFGTMLSYAHPLMCRDFLFRDRKLLHPWETPKKHLTGGEQNHLTDAFFLKRYFWEFLRQSPYPGVAASACYVSVVTLTY